MDIKEYPLPDRIKFYFFNQANSWEIAGWAIVLAISLAAVATLLILFARWVRKDN